ncbi:MAG: PEP-CTERM sorting domain-containing protein, partial [Pirellula sp.]
GTYSYGTLSSTDRAFGGLSTSTNFTTIGAEFTNAGSTGIASVLISFYQEKWRRGSRTSGEDRMDFQYSVNATSLSTGTWVDVDTLDVVSAWESGSSAALDGNANRVQRSGTISFASAVSPSSNFWIRWTDVFITGTNDGMAIDDFSLTATFVSSPPPAVVPEPSTLALFLGLSTVGGPMVLLRGKKRKTI